MHKNGSKRNGNRPNKFIWKKKQTAAHNIWKYPDLRFSAFCIVNSFLVHVCISHAKNILHWHAFWLTHKSCPGSCCRFSTTRTHSPPPTWFPPPQKRNNILTFNSTFVFGARAVVAILSADATGCCMPISSGVCICICCLSYASAVCSLAKCVHVCVRLFWGPFR